MSYLCLLNCEFASVNAPSLLLSQLSLASDDDWLARRGLILKLYKRTYGVEYISYSLPYSTAIVPSMVYSIFTKAALSDTADAAG